jgi:hypothetical protein
MPPNPQRKIIFLEEEGMCGMEVVFGKIVAWGK